MKRLSLHIAQQLVLGELSQPTSVIERLVQRCLDEVNFSANGLITLELNEADKALLASQDSQLLAGLRLEVAQDVSTGSVRIKANDTIVEDFVQDRLSAIARQLKLDDESWQENSALLSQDTPQEPSGE
jgi:flagellar biosynthesis/type III secretory pathway protein FliH